ncbi:MAG: peptidoglycan binding domain-containing protein, partial [Chloroflexota bacterium]|nr:peptidoglycan binding domain-containing protein [Chloroflexota bacterium]
MSAEEIYSEHGVTGRRLDDPYATRPLPLHEITDHPADLPLIGAPKAVSRTTRRPPSRGISGIVYLLLSLLVLVMLGAGGGLYYLDQSYQGKIYPNVTVQGLNVGELTQLEAEAALRARYGAFLQHPATLTYGQQSWQPSYSDVGISFDFKGAIASAYRAGRGNGLIENLQEVYAIWENGLDLPIYVTFDQNKLREYV